MQLKPILFFVFAMVLLSAPAYPSCVNPAGEEGEQVYNGTYHTMQFCDGTTWYSMKGGGGGGGGGSSLWTAGTGDDIYFNSGAPRVGIGTVSPAHMLSLGAGDIQLSHNQGIRWIDSTGTSRTIIKADNNNITQLRSAGGDIMFTDVSGSPLVTFTSAGNVGIGTTSPGAKLEVNGQVKITGGTPGVDKVLTSDAAGLASWTTEDDPQVSAVTNGQWCRGNGSAVTCDQAPPGVVDVQTFNASGTWTKPAGAVVVQVRAWGAGGGGANQAGGGGGGFLGGMFNAAALGATETVTIGVGGIGGVTGTAGGATTFGSLLTAYGGGGATSVGGGGGGAFGPGSSPGAGGDPNGAAAGADADGWGGGGGSAPDNIGGTAGYGGAGGGGRGSNGGAALYGGGGGGGAPGGATGAGGNSIFGGNGGAGDGTAGTQPGGGGGGGNNPPTAGNGGAGRVVVYTWK